LHHGEGHLPLCRCSLRLGQGRAHLLQCLIARQECGLHHVDRRTALHGLGALVQERVLHGSQPVLQPVVVGP
jgi:hypothetical protein